MEVTEVRINNVKNAGNLKAFANITLDEALVIKGLKVVNGKKGLFVSWPSTLGSDGEYYDQVFPLDEDLREEITDAVLEAYEDNKAVKDASKKKTSKKTAAKKSSSKKAKTSTAKKEEEDDDDWDDDEEDD